MKVPLTVANWSPDYDGYTLHVAASAGRWIACLSLAIYPSLFHKEFQTFSIEDICVERNDEEWRLLCGKAKQRRGCSWGIRQFITTRSPDLLQMTLTDFN